MISISSNLIRTVLASATFVSVAAGFHALLFKRLPDIFRSPIEDMSYGWFIPIFSIYVAWTERGRIRAAVSKPSWGGILFALPFLALGLLGVRGLQVRMEIVAFAGLLAAVVWAFFGRAAAKAVAFPVAFLLFCLPLATFLDIVTIHLRILATAIAYGVLETLGADVFRQGTMICAADGAFAIDVAEPCSGLRSIFALMALTAGYAYFSQPTWLRRAILFSLSVPIAILGNVMRILSICLVSRYASPELGSGFYHDYSGYVIFAVAMLLMFASGEAITRFCGRGAAPRKTGAGPDEAAGAAPAEPAEEGRTPLAVPVVAFAAISVAMAFLAVTPAPVLAEAPEARLMDVPGFSRTPVEITEAERTVLPADTVMEKCVYESGSAFPVYVTAVVGGASRSSIHRPEMCLPAQGWQMSSPRTRRVCGRDWRFISLRSGAAGESGVAYTFLNQEGYATASHTRRIFRDVFDRTFFNRIDRWVMVEVVTPHGDDAALVSAVETASRGLGW